MTQLIHLRYGFFTALALLFFSCSTKNDEVNKDEPLMVYIGSKDGYFYAIDAENGQQKWKYYTKASLDFSSAAIDEGVVYVSGTYDKVYAIDALSGKLKWVSEELEAVAYGTPFVYNQVVYFVDIAGTWYALDARNGKIKWKFGKKIYGQGSATAADGLVYFSGNGVYALDAETGRNAGTILRI